MILAKACATVTWLLFIGSILHHAMAVRLLRADRRRTITDPSARDLLFLGLLPGLTIVGALGTFLALVGLLRAEAMLVLSAGVIVFLRQDAWAIVRAIAGLLTDGWDALRRLDLIAIAGMAGLLALTTALFVLAQAPTDNIDAWVAHVPLARSLAQHHGFIYPQVGNVFYAAMPLFFHVLFAQALLFVDHFVAASAVNIAMLVAFMLGLSVFSRRARALMFLLILLLIGATSFFGLAATQPLTDWPRSAFAVAAALFAYRYLLAGRLYDVAMSGLLAGAAVSGKYTELLTVALIGVPLLAHWIRHPERWRHIFLFGLPIVVMAGYWYGKNWVVYGNPVFPFLFGHPGMSDDSLASYMREMTSPFDPADRRFVTNLLTLQGWRDFGFILYDRFLSQRLILVPAGILIVLGLLVRRARIEILLLWTVALFVVWYTLMFNHIRWAMPAYLMYLSTACIAAAALAESAILAWERPDGAMARWRRSTLPRRAVASPLWRWRRPALAAMALILATGMAAAKIARDGTLLPGSINRDMIDVTLGRASMADYLAARRAGYAIYRRIAEQDLRTVLQPFDNGAIENAAAYNGGRDGNWLLHYRTLPADPAALDAFLRQHQIRYFVYRPNLTATEIDRFGQAHVDLAYDVLRTLLPRSRRIMSDPFGWELYAIAASSP